MTQPTLDLYSQTPPLLHRPRLAAVACLLFAAAATAEILIGLLQVVLPANSTSEYAAQLNYICIVICLSCSLYALAAVCLVIADVTRHAKPPITLWPKRLMLIAILFYAAVHSGIEILGLILRQGGDPYPLWTVYLDYALNIHLPLFAIALAASSCGFALGLVYALQIAAFLHDKTFRRLSLAILGPAMLVLMGEFTLTLNIIARNNGHGIDLSGISHFLGIAWVTIECGLAVALIAFFLLLAHRLRRAAKLQPS